MPDPTRRRPSLLFICLHSFPTARSAPRGQRPSNTCPCHGESPGTAIILPAAPTFFSFSASSPLQTHTPTQTCLLLCSIYGETRWEDTWEPDTTFTARWCGMMEWPIWFRCTHSPWPALFCGPADPSCQEISGTSAELLS